MANLNPKIITENPLAQSNSLISLYILTRVLRSCRFPLYHVIIAFGRDPLLSHLISYRRSATNCVGVSNISTVNGRTVSNGK